MKGEGVCRKRRCAMTEPPLAHNRRQKLLQEAEARLEAEVQQLQALKKKELALLKFVMHQQSATIPGLCSLLLVEPARLEESLAKLEAAGLVVERKEGHYQVVGTTGKCERLRRIIEAME